MYVGYPSFTALHVSSGPQEVQAITQL